VGCAHRCCAKGGHSPPYKGNFFELESHMRKPWVLETSRSKSKTLEFTLEGSICLVCVFGLLCRFDLKAEDFNLHALTCARTGGRNPLEGDREIPNRSIHTNAQLEVPPGCPIWYGKR
jgi:hypothetical protein